MSLRNVLVIAHYCIVECNVYPFNRCLIILANTFVGVPLVVRTINSKTPYIIFLPHSLYTNVRHAL